METFRSKRAFIMTASSAAVGLGNIFRFPALAARYGISFIVFYTVALLTVGLPLLYAELCFGQSRGPSDFGSRVAKTLCGINCTAVLCCYTVFFALVLKGAATALFSGIADCAFLLFAAVLAVVCFGSAEKLSKISEIGIIFSVSVMLIISAIGLIKNPFSTAGLLYPSGRPFSVDFFAAVFGQVFFSLSLAVGVMTAYGSMLKRGTPLLKSALAVCLADFGISVVSTLVYLCLGGREGTTPDSLAAYPLLFSSFFGERVGRGVTLFFFLGLAFLCLGSVIAYIKAIAVHSKNQTKAAVFFASVSAAVGIFLISDRYERLIYFDQSLLPLIGLFAGATEAVFLSFKVEKFKPLLRFFIPSVLFFLLLRKIFI